MMKDIVKILMPVMLLLGTAAFSLAAQDNKGKEDKTNLNTIQEIQGEVSAVDKHGIAVVYKTDAKGVEQEVYIPLEKENIKMSHKRDIEDIQVGDTVKVEYETTMEKGKRSSVKATIVTFLKRPQKKPAAPELVEPEEPEESELPFKGIQE